MLYGIPDILSPSLLWALRAMGHGNEIVIADGNFSAEADATHRPVIELRGYSALEIVEAILAVMPLDEMTTPAYHIVETYDDEPLPVSASFRTMVQEAVELRGWQGDKDDLVGQVPRKPDFHNRAKQAFAVVATNDRTHYGCFILRKGALPEVAAGSAVAKEVWLGREDARAFGEPADFSRATIGQALGSLQGLVHPMSRVANPGRFRGRGDHSTWELEKHSFLRYIAEKDFSDLHRYSRCGPKLEGFLRAWVDHLKTE